MSGFAIADIVEILECKNVAVISQVLDVIISDTNCLRDKTVTSIVSTLMVVPELTSKAVDIFTVISAEHPDALDAETTNRVLTEAVTLSIDPKVLSCRNSLMGLLCNMTLSEANSEVFLSTQGESDSSPWKEALDEFLNYNPQAEVSADDGAAVSWDKLDPFQHVGSVLTNLCRLAPARKSMLQQSKGYLQRLLLQLRSSNPTRRRGSVAALRSLMFDPANHWWLAVDLRAARYLLYPLVVGTPFSDKEKAGMDALLWMRADTLAAANPRPVEDEGEGPCLGREGQMVTTVAAGEEPAAEQVLTPDEVEFSVMALECLLLLCQTRIVREQLRKQQVYYVVRNFDIEVNNDQVSAVTNEIVQLLMRDESYDDLAPVAVGEAGAPALGESGRVEILDDGNALTDGCD